ncbi:hypothetical protein J1N35_036313 [Gossypium stocksii]|uniref:Uncharacterized protein n=1 Tax=Gossypium stocksii TaxID=47602 RepID=A0A9D3ZKK5_9ROSI|nr:hypothetical protein J1N35_036313 [Gossypium stocksii]
MLTPTYVVFLMETKLNCRRMERVRCQCGFHNGIDVSSEGTRGGLSIGWKEGIIGPKVQTFRFEEWWLLEDSCEEEIRCVWNNSIKEVSNRLKNLGDGLLRWARRLKKDKGGRIRDLEESVMDFNGKERTNRILGDLIEAKL